MKANELKNMIVPIELMGKKFKMSFDFNALCEIEEVYGDFYKTLKDISKGKTKLKAIRALIYAGIKPRHKEVTVEEIGGLLTDFVCNDEVADYVMEQLDKAITLALPPPNNEGE